MWCVCWTQCLACCHVCSEFPSWWLLLLASVRISFGGHSNVGREVVRRQWRWWSCSAEKMSPLFELQQLDLSPPPFLLLLICVDALFELQQLALLLLLVGAQFELFSSLQLLALALYGPAAERHPPSLCCSTILKFKWNWTLSVHYSGHCTADCRWTVEPFNCNIWTSSSPSSSYLKCNS